jgi:hypothetical protein
MILTTCHSHPVDSRAHACDKAHGAILITSSNFRIHATDLDDDRQLIW